MRSLVRLQKLQDDHARATGGTDSIPVRTPRAYIYIYMHAYVYDACLQRRQDDDGELLDVAEELTVQQPPLAEPLWLTTDY